MPDLKNLTERFYKEVFDNRNIDALDEFIAADVVEHEEPPPGLVLEPGREGVKQMLSTYLGGFDPLGVTIHEQYQDGNTVIARVTFHGTHVGDFAGLPATGKSFSAQTIDIMRFEDGLVAEHWGQFDAVAMLTQLGAIPPME